MFELTPFVRHNSIVSNPFREMEEWNRSLFGEDMLAGIKADVKDTGSAYELDADLPGFDKKDIHIDLDDSTLTIHAERHSEAENKDEKTGYLRCERSYGEFSRSFDLTGVDAANVSAAYKDGVLKLTLPKLAEQAPTARRLEIE